MLIFAVRLIVEDQGNMLFLKQTKKNGGRFSLIGGNVEENEFAREALARETLEEAGISIDATSLHLVHVLHRRKLQKGETYIVLYFKADKWGGVPESQEPKKFLEVAWLPVNNLPDNLSKSTQHVLNCIKRGEIYSEFPARKKVLEFWAQFGEFSRYI